MVALEVVENRKKNKVKRQVQFLNREFRPSVIQLYYVYIVRYMMYMYTLVVGPKAQSLHVECT